MTAVSPALAVAAQQVWVVVQAKPGQEVRAKAELRNQGFEVYLPMRQFERKGELRAAPFFPGYLFAHVSRRPADWREIYSTYGVSGVLACSASRAHGVKDRVVLRLMAAEEGGFIKMGLAEDQAARTLKAGDRVLYDVGTADLEAAFGEYVDARRVVILLSLFGRDSEQIVDLRQIRTA